MSLKNCGSTKEADQDANVSVSVVVDVPKIIKYLCMAGVLIVGIIFGTKTFKKMLEEGFFEMADE
jgi:hypothetical protein